MRNLILLLTRHYYFILFLLLESLSFFLLFQNNHFQRSHFLNSSNAIAGNIYATSSNVTDYFNLKETNERLAAENTSLRNQLKKSYIYTNSSFMTVNDSLPKRHYVFLSAKVVNNSTNRRTNFLTLNAGSKQGVKKEMGVICGEGVVGIVRDVSTNFCSVMSVLNENTRIPVNIKKFGENSILTWNGIDAWHAEIKRVPSHLKLAQGDTIITNAYSSIFPEGVIVGFVDHFNKIAGNTFYDVTVRLSTDFNSLSYVNIVDNLMRDEKIELEKNTQHD